MMRNRWKLSRWLNYLKDAPENCPGCGARLRSATAVMRGYAAYVRVEYTCDTPYTKSEGQWIVQDGRGEECGESRECLIKQRDALKAVNS